jgi:hypothetical protein
VDLPYSDVREFVEPDVLGIGVGLPHCTALLLCGMVMMREITSSTVLTITDEITFSPLY